MQKLPPTFYQIISTDYLAQNFFVMIFAGWVIYFIDALFEGEYTLFLLIFALIATPIGLVTFYWRYNLITSTFIYGIETLGRVIQVDTISTGKKRRDYIIQYEYQHNGQMYQCRNRIKKNTFAKSLRQGQTVNLLMNEKNPDIAFIKDIYIEFL